MAEKKNTRVTINGVVVGVVPMPLLSAADLLRSYCSEEKVACEVIEESSASKRFEVGGQYGGHEIQRIARRFRNLVAA